MIFIFLIESVGFFENHPFRQIWVICGLCLETSFGRMTLNVVQLWSHHVFMTGTYTCSIRWGSLLCRHLWWCLHTKRCEKHNKDCQFQRHVILNFTSCHQQEFSQWMHVPLNLCLQHISICFISINASASLWLSCKNSNSVFERS